jgi:hypothetical protein
MQDASEFATVIADSRELWSEDFFGFMVSVECPNCHLQEVQDYTCVQLKPQSAPVELTEDLIFDSLESTLSCVCPCLSEMQILSSRPLILLCSALYVNKGEYHGGNIKYSRTLELAREQYKLIGVVDYDVSHLHYACRLCTPGGFVKISDQNVQAAIPDKGDNEDFTRSMVSLYRKSK